MTETVVIFVPGEARGKQRARAGNGRHYTPKKTVDAERIIGWEAKKVMAGRKPFEGPLALSIMATYTKPPSWSKKKTAAAFWKTSKPDLDNIYKMVDALNKIVWLDDAQVTKAELVKHYTTGAPGLRIEIQTLD